MYPTTVDALPEIALEELVAADGPGAGIAEGDLKRKLREIPESAYDRAANRDHFRALVFVN